MTDHELLKAISNIVQAKIEPLQNEIADTKASLQNEIAETKASLRNDITEATSSLREELLNEIADTKASLQDNIIHMQLTLENDIIPRLQTIESCYVSTYHRYAKGIDQLERMQSDIDVMKSVIEDHSRKLQKIS